MNGSYSKGTEFRRAPRNPIALHIKRKHIFSNDGAESFFFNSKIVSKSVHGLRLKNDLLFCNMNTRGARKAKREIVRVNATLGDCNLRIPQGRMC